MINGSIFFLVHQCSKKSSVSHPLNICWIFEKEKRLLDNSVPQYEAHVMEYFHEIEVRYQCQFC